MFGYPRTPVAWVAVWVFIIAVLLCIIAFFIYEYTKTESEEVSLWIWIFLIGSVSLLVISILMYAAGNRQIPNYKEIIVYDRGWDKNIPCNDEQKHYPVRQEVIQTVPDPLNPKMVRGNEMGVFREVRM